MFRTVLMALAVWAHTAAPVRAQTVLTFEDTVARARDRAAAVVVARARVAEAEATLVTASLRMTENPILEVGAGPRTGGDATHTDLDIGLTQPLGSSRQQRARQTSARAAIERARADAEHASRLAVFDAASAFLQGIAAAERLRIADQADMVSRELLAATERRYAAGDIAAIDLNLARIDRARSTAALASARADLTQAVNAVKNVLRIAATESVELTGTLDSREAPALETLETSVDRRPELVSLSADVREAEAQIELGRSMNRPAFGVRVGFEREEGDSILLGGLTIALPIFQKGQGVMAAGAAHASRARVELDTTRESALAELRAAYGVWRERAALARALADDALPAVADNQELGRRSYDAGEMNLMDLLLIRRDALDTATSVVTHRLEAAQSRLKVDFIAGALR
jgi:outer membrane protein, heavy metal efflux system